MTMMLPLTSDPFDHTRFTANNLFPRMERVLSSGQITTGLQ